MTATPALQAYWDQERRMIADHIRTFGVHLNYIADLPGDVCGCRACELAVGPDDGPMPDVWGDDPTAPPKVEEPFCYTIGLFGVGHPELVVVGLTQSGAVEVLHHLSHLVLDHGHDLTPGEEVEVVSVGTVVVKVLVEELPNPGQILFGANEFYDRPPWVSVPAYLVTVSDPEGRFPWEEGHVALLGEQPRPGQWRA